MPAVLPGRVRECEPARPFIHPSILASCSIQPWSVVVTLPAAPAWVCPSTHSALHGSLSAATPQLRNRKACKIPCNPRRPPFGPGRPRDAPWWLILPRVSAFPCLLSTACPGYQQTMARLCYRDILVLTWHCDADVISYPLAILLPHQPRGCKQQGPPFVQPTAASLSTRCLTQ